MECMVTLAANGSMFVALTERGGVRSAPICDWTAGWPSAPYPEMVLGTGKGGNHSVDVSLQSRSCLTRSPHN